jgi:hypothetical protein
MTLAIYDPDDVDVTGVLPFPGVLQVHAHAEEGDSVWSFYKLGKRGGKLYRNHAGTVLYESNLPAGSKKQDRQLTDKEQVKQARYNKLERRKLLRQQSNQSRKVEQQQPLSTEQVAKADRKLKKLRSLGAKAINNIAYATKQSLQSKKQALQQAAQAIRGPDQGTTMQRAKKAGIALSKAAFASYHLHAKRYGKPMAVVIESVKATINFAVSAPFVVVPGAGAFIRNSITGPAIDYVARKTAKQVIHMRQLARGRWKPKQFSEPPPAESLSFDRLVKIIRTSLHVDAIKAKIPVPRVSLEQVARSLETLLNTAFPEEQFSQRKAA